MKLTNTTLGKYFSWFSSFDTEQPMAKVIENISNCSFTDSWHIVIPEFIKEYWDKEIMVIECEKSYSSSGEHDVAIMCDDFILGMSSIDYAFTPMEESKAV